MSRSVIIFFPFASGSRRSEFSSGKLTLLFDDIRRHFDEKWRQDDDEIASTCYLETHTRVFITSQIQVSDW